MTFKCLSGWWYTYPRKNMSSSDWIIIPTLGEKLEFMFQTSSCGREIRLGSSPATTRCPLDSEFVHSRWTVGFLVPKEWPIVRWVDIIRENGSKDHSRNHHLPSTRPFDSIDSAPACCFDPPNPWRDAPWHRSRSAARMPGPVESPKWGKNEEIHLPTSLEVPLWWGCDTGWVCHGFGWSTGVTSQIYQVRALP